MFSNDTAKKNKTYSLKKKVQNIRNSKFVVGLLVSCNMLESVSTSDKMVFLISCEAGVITSATEGGRRLCFHLSVCLYVCEHDISKSYGQIRMKFGEQVCDKDELIRFWGRSESRSRY